MSAKFIRGDARLAEMLADTETRAEVDAIVDEMRQIDRGGPSRGDCGGESSAPARSPR